MKAYKKHGNSGPVPYPDGSGKMLHDGAVAYGEAALWDPLVALGYVEHVPELEGFAGHGAMPSVQVVVEAPAPVVEVVEAPVAEVVAEEVAPAVEVAVVVEEVVADEPGGMNDGGVADEGTGVEALDSPAPGGSDAEGPAVRGPAKRRGKRG